MTYRVVFLNLETNARTACGIEWNDGCNENSAVRIRKNYLSPPCWNDDVKLTKTIYSSILMWMNEILHHFGGPN